MAKIKTHVVEEISENKSKSIPHIIDLIVFDSFNKLTNDDEKVRKIGSLNLLEHLVKNENDEKVTYKVFFLNCKNVVF